MGAARMRLTSAPKCMSGQQREELANAIDGGASDRFPAGMICDQIDWRRRA
jgi:hypothetical protein